MQHQRETVDGPEYELDLMVHELVECEMSGMRQVAEDLDFARDSPCFTAENVVQRQLLDLGYGCAKPTTLELRDWR